MEREEIIQEVLNSRMRRVSLYIAVGFLTFVFGVLVNGLVPNVKPVSLQSDPMPQFVAVSSIHDPDYHIYFYKTRDGDDLEEINVYADFRSREVTLQHFESNAQPDGSTVIEIGSKFDANGHVIGRRGVTVFNDVKAVRIFWTDGDSFWIVQAPSMELAQQFEESAALQSIRMSHKARLK